MINFKAVQYVKRYFNQLCQKNGQTRFFKIAQSGHTGVEVIAVAVLVGGSGEIADDFGDVIAKNGHENCYC